MTARRHKSQAGKSLRTGVRRAVTLIIGPVFEQHELQMPPEISSLLRQLTSRSEPAIGT